MQRHRFMTQDERRMEWESLARRAGYDLRALAELVGVTTRHIQRCFREDFGASPHAWLRTRRLDQARTQLREAQSVKEVAFDAGFKQVSHFSRDFKRRFGYSPSTILGLACGGDAVSCERNNREDASSGMM